MNGDGETEEEEEDEEEEGRVGWGGSSHQLVCGRNLHLPQTADSSRQWGGCSIRVGMQWEGEGEGETGVGGAR